MSALQITWYGLIGVLLCGYSILDGFDLGVGFWHLLARDERERGLYMRTIGPFWDGNEVWLLTGGGALFATFPPVYATVFSGFYLVLMLVLVGLILRAVSLEFRFQLPAPRWRRAWDWAFSLGSLLPALLLGVALGNILRGLPLDVRGNYSGGFWGLLSPYALLVGLCGLAFFATHGAAWIALKTDGELHERALRRGFTAWLVWAGLLATLTAASLIGQDHLLVNFHRQPALWLLPVALGLALAFTGWSFRRRRALAAFIASSASMAFSWVIVGASLFPNLVPARPDPALSLTAGNSSSSELTLSVMLVITLIGMPLVLGYTIWVYHTFRGKVSEGDYGH